MWGKTGGNSEYMTKIAAFCLIIFVYWKSVACLFYAGKIWMVLYFLFSGRYFAGSCGSKWYCVSWMARCTNNRERKDGYFKIKAFEGGCL